MYLVHYGSEIAILFKKGDLNITLNIFKIEKTQNILYFKFKFFILRYCGSENAILFKTGD